MTRHARWAVLLLGLIFGALSFAQTLPGSAGIVVTDVIGTVRYRIGDSEARTVVKGQIIPFGARVATGDDSYAVLTFPDGQIVAMGPKSRLIIRVFVYIPTDIDKSRVVLNVTDGSVRMVMGAIGQHDPGLLQLQVGTKTTAQTPNLPRGGDLGLVMLGSAALVQVNQGKVALRVAGESYPLATGQAAIVQADGFVQMGGLARLEAQPDRTADDKEMFEQFREITRFTFPRSPRQTMITLATPPYDEKKDEELAAAGLPQDPTGTTAAPQPAGGVEGRPPLLATSGPNTAPGGGGGGGGIPCPASCN